MATKGRECTGDWSPLLQERTCCTGKCTRLKPLVMCSLETLLHKVEFPCDMSQRSHVIVFQQSRLNTNKTLLHNVETPWCCVSEENTFMPGSEALAQRRAGAHNWIKQWLLVHEVEIPHEQDDNAEHCHPEHCNPLMRPVRLEDCCWAWFSRCKNLSMMTPGLASSLERWF